MQLLPVPLFVILKYLIWFLFMSGTDQGLYTHKIKCYLWSSSGQCSAVGMVFPVGVWMRMVLRFLAANRMDIPYLVSKKFLILLRLSKEPIKFAFELLKLRKGYPRLPWTLVCGNLLGLSSGSSGVSSGLIMETWYTWCLYLSKSQ